MKVVFTATIQRKTTVFTVEEWRVCSHLEQTRHGRSEAHAHCILWHQKHCLLKICSSWCYSEFWLLLWCFEVPEKKFVAKRLKLWKEQMHLHMRASFEMTKFFTNNNMAIIPHSLHSLDLGPCDFALFPTWNGRWKATTLTPQKPLKKKHKQCWKVSRKRI